MVNELFSTAVEVSYNWFVKNNSKQPTIFVCSPQIFLYVLGENLEATVKGCIVEVDDTLFGISTSGFYWC